MKIISRYFTLIITSVTAMTAMISSTLPIPAFATSGNYDVSWGNAVTAREKEFVASLYDCTANWRNPLMTGWSIDIAPIGNEDTDIIAYYQQRIYPNRVANGEWFRVLGGWLGTNPAVEAVIDNGYHDGSFSCAENNNAIVSSTMNAINAVEAHSGITMKDLICDKSDGYISGGLLNVGNSRGECGQTYGKNRDSNHYFLDTKSAGEKEAHFKKVLGDSIFSPTTLETYYIIYDAFINACTDGPSTGNNATYTIQEINSNNDVVTVNYTGRNHPDPDTDQVVYLGSTASMTCRGMEAILNGNAGEFVEDLKKYAEYLKANNLEEEEPDDDTAEQNCQNSGGAGSLGWIVCSILDWMSDATENLYNDVVKPALRVEPELFKGGDSIGAEKAWGYFRDFANILFIIIVLVVIFSQLTGVGIDNYGIKKILPKLVIVAVLVNLSYLICLLCVDLSNIVGNGAQYLFNSIPVKEINPDTSNSGIETITVSTDEGTSKVEIDTYTSSSDTGDTGALINTGIVAVGTVSAAVGAVAIYSNPALLLTLFVSVLGVLISVLFVFILLAGRKAAIVLLTVISPIAFILYMLPNTKKIFDKWLNLWKAMLIVYPVCGLLIGGGNFASRLMLTVGDKTSVATIFTAMIVGIVPIFFIPSLIKGAYAALGTIGGTIAGFGGRLSGGATKGIRNSNAYKNTQQMGLDRKTRKQAGLNKQGDATKVGRLQRRMASTRVGRFIGADRRMNARTKAAKKEMAEQEEAAATSMAIMAASEMGRTKPVMAVDGSGTATGRQLFDGQRENYYASKFMQATEKKDRKAMNAALAAAKSAGVKDKDIAKMVRHAANTGKLSGKDNAQMGLWLQGQASTNNALAKDIELQDWAAKGGSEKLGNYGEYARSHMSPSDLDKNKVGNASTESMAGLAVAGKLPTSLAKEVLLDNTMNLSPDKRILLGAINEGKINTSASAEDLKRDADLLSTNPSAGVTNITATAADVNKWTAPTPRPVVIR